MEMGNVSKRQQPDHRADNSRRLITGLPNNLITIYYSFIFFLQKNALFERWLTLEKSDDASTITSSELRSLGHMTCGAETGHIDVISHSVYS